MPESEPAKPRQSDPVMVDGKATVFYWCRACNRCLPHWRSAFCEVHRESYKRMRRRRRTRSAVERQPPEYVRVPRDVLEDLYQSVRGHLEAHQTASKTGDEAHREQAKALRRRAFDVVLTRLPDYL